MEEEGANKCSRRCEVVSYALCTDGEAAQGWILLLVVDSW